MRDKNKKIQMIANIITVLCGIGGLILLLNGGVDFKHPMIWLLCLMVLSSISALITQGLSLKTNTKKKK